jgi:hypothetical protein
MQAIKLGLEVVYVCEVRFSQTPTHPPTHTHTHTTEEEMMEAIKLGMKVVAAQCRGLKAFAAKVCVPLHLHSAILHDDR